MDGDTNCEVVRAENKQSGHEIWFGIGEANQNRGIWDKTTNWWMINLDENGTLMSAGKQVVCVESWRAEDGSSWYRKYSDGWIEQGGITDPVKSNQSSDKYKTVTFRIAFTQTPTLTASFENTFGTLRELTYYIGKYTSAEYPNNEQRAVTPTMFYWQMWRYYGDSLDGGRLHWYACGY